MPKDTTAETFVREEDYDLSTLEGRLAWFSKAFDVTPPTLDYIDDDPARPDRDSLLDWAMAEGLSLDWLYRGSVAGLVAALRAERTGEKD